MEPKVFKEMTRYFKEGMTHYSPVIGMAAYEAGLLHDLRFFSSLDAGEKEGQDQRVYTLDKPHMFDIKKDKRNQKRKWHKKITTRKGRCRL